MKGKMALLRISATALTPAQIAKIYADELPLFQPGAACTLAGSDAVVNALAHDPDLNLLHASETFQRLMADNGITCSMSRSGNCWDNAAAESFFSSLKMERVRGKVYRTRDQARADVFDYVERFYNPNRRHSTIGYMSPIQYEERAMEA